jgi:hypothetical protein
MEETQVRTTPPPGMPSIQLSLPPPPQIKLSQLLKAAAANAGTKNAFFQSRFCEVNRGWRYTIVNRSKRRNLLSSISARFTVYVRTTCIVADDPKLTVNGCKENSNYGFKTSNFQHVAEDLQIPVPVPLTTGSPPPPPPPLPPPPPPRRSSRRRRPTRPTEEEDLRRRRRFPLRRRTLIW